MRHKGSISHTNLERDEIVPLLYRKATELVEWPADTMKICEKAATLPVKKFYISHDAAVEYVRHRYYHGVRKEFRSPYKQQLYDSLYDVFIRLVNNPVYSNRILPDLVSIAIHSPAPCSGLAPFQFYCIMLRYKKKRAK